MVRLQHMLDAAREALSFAGGKTRGYLDTDRMLVLALTRDLEIIGEAASRVTPEGQESYPDIPWRDVIGMRNWLVHAYFDVDLDILWDTVAEDLPSLVAEIEKAIRLLDTAD